MEGWSGERIRVMSVMRRWALVAPYVTLMSETAPQRRYAVREVFNGLRWLVRAGAPWRMLPNDPPAVGGGVSTDAAVAAGGGV